MKNLKRITTPMLGSVVALLVLAGCLVVPTLNSSPVANAAASSDNPLIGIWEMTVQGEAATYLYKYAISEGTWVTIGNIDGGFFNFRYGPTLGAYLKNADGSYRYREIGWTYARGGVCNGSFESTGTFLLDASGNRFSGPGVFKQFDLTGKTILTDNFTAVATRDSF